MTRGGHGRPLLMAPFDKPGIVARAATTSARVSPFAAIKPDAPQQLVIEWPPVFSYFRPEPHRA